MADLMGTSTVVAELAQLLGPEHVSGAVADRLAYRHGTWTMEYKAIATDHVGPGPQAVVWPTTVDDVVRVVQWAAQRRIPLIPYGGGSGIVGGTIASPQSVVVDTKRLCGLTVDAESLVVEAGCGWFGSELDAVLRTQYGVTLGHYPQSLHSSTLGGWLATRATGIMSTKYGRMEDRVEGLEVVTGVGDRVALGGGPPASEGPDLVQLFLGSEGRLGIMTKARFRVELADQPEAIRVWTVPTVAAGLAVVQWLVQHGVKPTVTRLFDPEESQTWFGTAAGKGAVLLLHFQGLAALVTAEVAVAEDQATRLGAQRLPDVVAQRWWDRRYDTASLLRTVQRPTGIAETIEVGASWQHLLAVYEAMMAAVRPRSTIAYAHFSHFYPSGGSLYVIVHADAEHSDWATVQQRYREILDAALQASFQAGGGISHHHGIGRARSSWLTKAHSDSIAIFRRVQAVLDPAGIFNPGVLFEEASVPHGF